MGSKERSDLAMGKKRKNTKPSPIKIDALTWVLSALVLGLFLCLVIIAVTLGSIPVNVSSLFSLAIGALLTMLGGHIISLRRG